MKRKHQVAVILVNYNSSTYTLNCVNSIIAQTTGSLPYQIIIIDNNSRPEEYEKLLPLRTLKQAILFRSRLNVGFSGANMIGVQLAEADYYYFLNNDCILLNDVISILYTFSEKHAEVASCTGEMFTADMEYHHSFTYFPSLALTLLGSGLLRRVNPSGFPRKRIRYKNPMPVDLISGSSMFIKATPFEEMGGFDTQYFLYCEEEDIALRLKRSGYQTYLVPEAKYQHFIRKSTDADDFHRFLFLKEFYISLLYYYRKNYGFGYRAAVQFFLFFKMLSKSLTRRNYFKLAFFIAAGAHVKHSLRFRQKISQD
jgi:GT2 family glycosyltransferase